MSTSHQVGPRRHETTTALTRFALSPQGAALLAVGPVLSVLAAPLSGWDPTMVHNLQLVLLVAWAPVLPVAVPALLTQDLRDAHRALRSRVPGSLAVYLFVTGPARLVRASWLNLAGVATAAALV